MKSLIAIITSLISISRKSNLIVDVDPRKELKYSPTRRVDESNATLLKCSLISLRENKGEEITLDLDGQVSQYSPNVLRYTTKQKYVAIEFCTSDFNTFMYQISHLCI